MFADFTFVLEIKYKSFNSKVYGMNVAIILLLFLLLLFQSKFYASVNSKYILPPDLEYHLLDSLVYPLALYSPPVP